MKFSIRQLLAVTLIVALSIQARIQWKLVASLKAPYQVEWTTYTELESKARPLRQRTTVCKMVVKDWPYPSEEYLAAKERFDRLGMNEDVTNDR